MSPDDAKLLREGDRVYYGPDWWATVKDKYGSCWPLVEIIRDDGCYDRVDPKRLYIDPKILEGHKSKEPPKMPPLYIAIYRKPDSSGASYSMSQSMLDKKQLRISPDYRIVRIPGEGEPLASITDKTKLRMRIKDGAEIIGTMGQIIFWLTGEPVTISIECIDILEDSQ